LVERRRLRAGDDRDRIVRRCRTSEERDGRQGAAEQDETAKCISER
jgi:hypothetical protein